MNYRKSKLIEYLPNVLQDTNEFKVIFDIIDNELDLLNFNKKDVIKQCFIDTATWGLELWEKRFGIENNLNKNYEERREIIKAKRRGYGTVNKEKLKSIVEAFLNEGYVDIQEYQNRYSFLVSLESNKGFLYGFNNLYSIIDEIKPAHLKANYKLISILRDKLNLFFTIKTGEEISVYPWTPKSITSKGSYSVNASINQNMEIVSIYTKMREE